MTLEQAIEHCHEKAEEIRKANEEMPTDCKLSEDLCECANEHEQLVSWLEELKQRREADRWISVKDKLPDDLEPVNITWINPGIYFNGQWYWWSTLCADTLAEYSNNYYDIVDEAIEITHWKPLPKPYESEAENE